MSFQRKNKCCEVASAPDCQKKLLKVVGCLWNQYIVNRTPLTDQFFAEPTTDNYSLMVNELNSINTLIGQSPAIASLDDNTQVRIIAADAAGDIFYSSNLSSTLLDGTVYNEKNIQRLNTDECLQTVYQVRPTFIVDTSNNNEVSSQTTEVMVSKRTGCNGVSNTGFLSLYVNVSIENYPFNSCSTDICLFDTCKPTPTPTGGI